MKSFVSFLEEMPQINTYHSKELMNNMSNQNREMIHKSDSKESHLGDGIHYKNIDGDHVYYKKDNDGKPKEFSVVSSGNTHRFTHKGNGDSRNIHSFMIKHAEKHGRIQSDTSNTEGSKKLWTSLIKSKPKSKSFYVVNKYTREKTQIDHNNIDKMSPHIWGTSSKHNETRIVMQHNDEE